MLKDDNPIFQFQGPWGVPIQIGASIILLPLILVSFNGSPEAMMFDLIFVTLLIGSILAHELGHAWGSLIQNVRVRRIMLHGGGGFCEHSASTTRYEDELIVAMGPIVNLVIWAVASLAEPYFQPGYLSWSIYYLAQINLFLALFNLLPVMPLDGGKLFQLLLMRFLPSVTATQISGWVGVVLAVLWVPLMLFVYMSMGFVLFFFPPIKMHWQMATASR
ncbi:site-2 protease family protein [Litoreibacter sp.]|nr:site-2 protease family protein [Litoreibacter sp.]